MFIIIFGFIVKEHVGNQQSDVISLWSYRKSTCGHWHVVWFLDGYQRLS